MKTTSINWLHLGKIFSPVILLLFLMAFMQLQANKVSDLPKQTEQEPVLSSGNINRSKSDHIKLVMFSADDDFTGIKHNKVNSVYVKGIKQDVTLQKMDIKK